MRPYDKAKNKRKTLVFFQNIYKNLKHQMFGDDGILWNLVFVLVNLAGIIAVPLMYLLACIWSLQQIGVINPDIYAPIFTINDVFMSSSYEFWIRYLDYSGIFYIICLLGILFCVTGILEFI